MTEDNQHNAGEQQTPMQPQPLPGQVFVRPGIDDRPDYEKTLTEETKAALKRLAVQQNPTLTWQKSEGAEDYTVTVAADKKMENVVYEKSGIKGESCTDKVMCDLWEESSRKGYYE